MVVFGFALFFPTRLGQGSEQLTLSICYVQWGIDDAVKANIVKQSALTEVRRLKGK